MRARPTWDMTDEQARVGVTLDDRRVRPHAVKHTTQGDGCRRATDVPVAGGTIIGLSGKDLYRIHYDNDEASWDENVGPARLKK
jgi:hypothetical protein